MQLIRGDLASLPKITQPTGVTLGNFDGVHLGHQFLLDKLISKSQQEKWSSAVLCFEPHPEAFFRGGTFSYIQTLEQKRKKLEEQGVENLFVQDFSSAFSELAAEDFLRQYLSQFQDLRYLLVGYDFRFGKGGAGNFELLKKFFADKNCQVEQASPFDFQGETVSSSLIRGCIEKGEVEKAAVLLGSPFEIEGEVKKGQALGRQLGFPTANLHSVANMLPGRGVYVCRAQVEGVWHLAVTNVGLRPTVSGEGILVETHLLDFSGDLYGQAIPLQFFKRIRGEKKFENTDILKKQIAEDIAVARDFFRKGANE